MTKPTWTPRPLEESEWDRFVAVLENAFGESHSQPMHDLERSVHEIDRSIVVEDAGTLAGIAAIYSLAITVPGGPQPMAGVTWVGVLPTYRRRGVLSAMMRHQLHDLHDSGAESVAALWASEPAIYGRFGYGPASRALTMDIRRSPAALATAPHDPSLRLRLVDPAASVDLVETVYDSVRAQRPGMHARDERWRRRETWDDPSARSGRSELRCLVAADDGGLRGYARYRTEPNWAPGGSATTVHVREAFAVDPAAHAAMFRYLCDLDLTVNVRVSFRPLDDPLLDLLTDLRRSAITLVDSLFVRLVDVDRALTARAYATELDIVFDVSDGFCPWNEGRWRLRTGAGGATCERTTGSADLALPVTSLGAAHLGSPGALARLGRAGLVEELTPGALRRASLAFSGDCEPWAPFVW